MKRILVTGANGFIGGYLCRHLKADGFEVIGHTLADGDISQQALTYEHIDWVFHLAALTFVPESWENPVKYTRVNVIGTENVLELCRRNKCGMTYLSSYVYGEPQ